MEIVEIVVGVFASIGVLWGLFKYWAKKTKTTKDDEIVAKVDPIVSPLIDALDGEDDSAKQ